MGTKPVFPAIGTRLTAAPIHGDRKIPNCWTGSGQLGTLRREFSELLANGDYLPVLWNRDLFCFVRRQGNRTLLVAVNRATSVPSLAASGALPGFAGAGRRRQLAAEEGVVLLYES